MMPVAVSTAASCGATPVANPARITNAGHLTLDADGEPQIDQLWVR
jgi:hypothetical protein